MSLSLSVPLFLLQVGHLSPTLYIFQVDQFLLWCPPIFIEQGKPFLYKIDLNTFVGLTLVWGLKYDLESGAWKGLWLNLGMWACFIPNIIFYIIISFSFDALSSVHKSLINRIRLHCTPSLRGNCLSETPVLSLFLAHLTRNSDKPNIGEPPFKPQNNKCQCNWFKLLSKPHMLINVEWSDLRIWTIHFSFYGII